MQCKFEVLTYLSPSAQLQQNNRLCNFVLCIVVTNVAIVSAIMAVVLWLFSCSTSPSSSSVAQQEQTMEGVCEASEAE